MSDRERRREKGNNYVCWLPLTGDVTYVSNGYSKLHYLALQMKK